MSDYIEQLVQDAIQLERERIIKLIEKQTYDSTVKGLSWIPDGSELTQKDLIELIKGEQK